MKRIICICAVIMGMMNTSCNVSGKEYETFDIHFVIVTDNPLAHSAVTDDVLKNEIKILNKYFVKEDRSPIIKFRFKSAAFFDEIKNSKCSFVALNWEKRVFDFELWTTQFNLCSDPKVKDKHAINFYIYDSYTLKQGFKNRDGRGSRNRNQPFVFLDWERLNHSVQAPEEHEMGHAFGLRHFCSMGASPTSSTNIMSGPCAGGFIGKRDIGFNTEQVKIIMHNVPLIKAKLAEP